MTTELTVNPKEYGLEESKALEMVNGLSTTIAEREVLKEAYLDVIDLEITEENLATFKELRLKIRTNRTTIEKWHKTNKAFYLAGGRFVDAIKNKEVLENQEMETKLMDAEKYFENLEKERIAKLQDQRVKLLSEFVEDANERDLANMEDDVWQSFYETKKQAHLDKLQAEKEAEEKRIEEAKAEAERIEAQRIENEKLKAEAEKREKEIEAERIKQAKIQAEKDAKAKAEREKIEAENKAKLDAERKEREKIEAELKAKQLAEAKEIAKRNAEILEAKKEAEKLAKAPVKKQLNLWVDSFNIDLPNSELLNNEKALLIKSKFDAFKNWAKSEIETL